MTEVFHLSERYSARASLSDISAVSLDVFEPGFSQHRLRCLRYLRQKQSAESSVVLIFGVVGGLRTRRGLAFEAGIHTGLQHKVELAGVLRGRIASGHEHKSEAFPTFFRFSSIFLSYL